MELKTSLEVLGLVLAISGVIAGSYIVVETLIRSTVFSVFWKVNPAFLRSFYPNDIAILQFTIRANGSLYSNWGVALIYLFLLPIVFSIFVGCWVFLILRLLGIFDIGPIWLTIWFILVAINHILAAVGQHALEIRFHDHRLRTLGITNRMLSDLPNTMKRWSYYFLTNWIKAPITTLLLLLIIVLFVLLHWPAWLIQIVPKFRFDLTNARIRRYYYAWYAVIFGVSGLILAFIFK
jgi:hypothetical protein